MKEIPQNIRVMITSIVPLIVVVILFFVVGNFGIAKITDIRDQVQNAQKDENVLSQKARLLETVSSTLGNFPDLATSALPEDNPVLEVTSQLKNVAFASGVSISNIKSGPAVQDPSGLSRADMTFDADGTRSQIISFLKSMANSAPITVLDKMKLTESGGAAKATVSIKSYWAPLPKTLPTVTQALNDLTPDEKAVLAQIATLTQPAFVSVQPAGGAGKTDPFSF